MTGLEVVEEAAEHVQDLVDPDMDRAKHVVVLWYQENIADLLNSLGAFAPRGSSVTVISPEKPEVRPTSPLIRPPVKHASNMHDDLLYKAC